MTKKLIIQLSSCFVLSISLVLVLLAISQDMRQRPGSFLRQFPPHPALEGDSLNIGHNSYYIAGGTPHTVYLGNYHSPLNLLSVNIARLDTQHLWLNVKGVMDQKFWSARVKVDSPYFYVTDGAVPRIFKGNVNTRYAERYPFDSSYYREIVPLTANSFAVKTLLGNPRQNIIGKISTAAPHFTHNSEVLKKQIDGLFCTDGMLHYNKEYAKLIYLYYYRNEFFVLDTSLFLTYKGHTLDTISQAQIKVATIATTGDHTMAAPPLFVNKGSCTSGKWLFVNSNIPAANQSVNAFSKGEIIDVYDLSNGTYLFSFYVYNYWDTKRMIEFNVFGDKMIVLYDKLIRVFDLRSDFFPIDDISG